MFEKVKGRSDANVKMSDSLKTGWLISMKVENCLIGS